MKKVILIISAVVFMTTACNESFEEINANINQPETVTLDVAIVGGTTNVLEHWGLYYDRYAGAFTQHFAGNHATGITMDRYEMTPADFSTFGWSTMYNSGLMDAKRLIELAEEDGSPHYVGVGQIVTALGLGYLTDIYGDIPYTDALQGKDSPAPTYDSQETIYSTIQTLLDNAITNLAATSNQTLGSSDLFYGGNTGDWTALAHMLKARYYNHLSKRDPAGSATSALASLTAAYAAGFDGTNDLVMPYDGSAVHQNPWFNLWENNLIIASNNFMTQMQTQADPRIHAYWDSLGVDGTNVGLAGKTTGFGTSSVSYSPVGPEGYFGTVGSSVLIATFFEAKFIEAEANARLGNTAAAAAASNAAVAANIAKVVSGGNDVGLTAAYTAAYGSLTGGEANLMQLIMEEKYKAMFTQGIEGWVDVRRHDYQYPSYLAVPINNTTSTPVAADFIRRVPYPADEQDFNVSNIPSVTAITGRLWWDQ